MTTGLTLGKFAPLHKGHQYLIETALNSVDKLVVMIYDSPETNIPLPVRSQWIRTLYPTAEVIEAWNGPTETGYTEEIKRKNEEYILDTLAGRKIDKFFSSEPYGAHVSKALNAENCVVDMERTTFPISGTAVRHKYTEHKNFLHPLVLQDVEVYA